MGHINENPLGILQLSFQENYNFGIPAESKLLKTLRKFELKKMGKDSDFSPFFLNLLSTKLIGETKT